MKTESSSSAKQLDSANVMTNKRPLFKPPAASTETPTSVAQQSYSFAGRISSASTPFDAAVTRTNSFVSPAPPCGESFFEMGSSVNSARGHTSTGSNFSLNRNSTNACPQTDSVKQRRPGLLQVPASGASAQQQPSALDAVDGSSFHLSPPHFVQPAAARNNVSVHNEPSFSCDYSISELETQNLAFCNNNASSRHQFGDAEHVIDLVDEYNTQHLPTTSKPANACDISLFSELPMFERETHVLSFHTLYLPEKCVKIARDRLRFRCAVVRLLYI